MMNKVIFLFGYLLLCCMQVNGQELINQFITTEYAFPIHHIVEENSFLLGTNNSDSEWKIARYNSSGVPVDEIVSSLDTRIMYFDFIEDDRLIAISREGEVYLRQNENAPELSLVDSLEYNLGNEHRISKVFRKGNEIIAFGVSTLSGGPPPFDVWYVLYRINTESLTITRRALDIESSKITELKPLENGRVAMLYRVELNPTPIFELRIYDNDFNLEQSVSLDGIFFQMDYEEGKFLVAGSVNDTSSIKVVTADYEVIRFYDKPNEITGGFIQAVYSNGNIYALEQWVPNQSWFFRGEITLYKFDLLGNIEWSYVLGEEEENICCGHNFALDLFELSNNELVIMGQTGVSDVLTTSRLFIDWIDPNIIQYSGKVQENEIEVFPNPTSGYIQIQGIKGGGKVTVKDSLGRVVRYTRFEESLDLSSLPAGLYTLFIKAEHKAVYISKVVKR